MKDTEKGVKELNLEKDKKIFNHCFSGKRPCGSDVGLLGQAIWRSRSAFSVCRGMWSEVGGFGVMEHRPMYIIIGLPQHGKRKKGRPILCGSR